MVIWEFDFLVKNVSGQPFATGNEVNQYKDNGHDQQDVNESADGVTGHETEQPKNQENYRQSV
jgi:hypothetical protein